MESQSQNKLSTPLAIVFSGLLIAGSILYGKVGGSTNALNQDPVLDQGSNPIDQIRPVSSKDHIRGNQNADIFVVEYSDTECPFCKQFHADLKQVISEYQSEGKVAWVYRHFPLDQLHSKARSEAVALECAAEQGGNEKFWQYTDRLYEVTPSNNGLDPAELPKIAAYVGLNVQNFQKCLTSSKYNDKIEEDVQNAVATGGNGTPWSIIVSKNGKKYPLSGAQPAYSIKQLIDRALLE